jgi:hypothetical protein
LERANFPRLTRSRCSCAIRRRLARVRSSGGRTKPDQGRALADGRPIEGPGRHRLVMFQESALFPWLTVFGTVMFGLNLRVGRQKYLNERTDLLRRGEPRPHYGRLPVPGSCAAPNSYYGFRKCMVGVDGTTAGGTQNASTDPAVAPRDRVCFRVNLIRSTRLRAAGANRKSRHVSLC